MPTLPKERILNKHINCVRASKDGDALQVDVCFKEGGALLIRLSRPPDWGWRGMLARRPHEVCMRWISPEHGFYYVCQDDADELRRLSDTWKNQHIRNIGAKNGVFHLTLSDGDWTPSIHWMTGQDVTDTIQTKVQLEYQD